MSKRIKKRVVVSSSGQKKKIAPTVSKSRISAVFGASNDELLYGKRHYIMMASGIGLMFIGFLLMLGGEMPDKDTWDPDLIYSFRRIVLAPVFILAGLILEVITVFKK